MIEWVTLYVLKSGKKKTKGKVNYNDEIVILLLGKDAIKFLFEFEIEEYRVYVTENFETVLLAQTIPKWRPFKMGGQVRFLEEDLEMILFDTNEVKNENLNFEELIAILINKVNSDKLD